MAPNYKSKHCTPASAPINTVGQSIYSAISPSSVVVECVSAPPYRTAYTHHLADGKRRPPITKYQRTFDGEKHKSGDKYILVEAGPIPCRCRLVAQM